MTAPADLFDALVVRLRAAGCVFAEEEARLLLDHVGSSSSERQSDLPRRSPGADVSRPDVLEQLVTRRVAGEPLEHVLGWVELAGQRWSVGPGVFVPRRRSELMVRTALAQWSVRSGPTGVIVDLCCGCGAVGGAVLHGLGDRTAGVSLHASDVDAAAVAHARRNLAPWAAAVHQGDLFGPLPTDLRGEVDLLLCHAPYVPTAAIAHMPPEARDHEPSVALDGGTDGLDVLRRVVAEAPRWLRDGGSLLFEVGTDQVPGALDLVTGHGLRGRVVRDDDAGGTVVVATAGGARASR